ncbi:MAG: hypothetical protein Q8L14_14710 [Myxococcales bacterium]|nr:hypothetical protein [Myxococcales bacterium]
MSRRDFIAEARAIAARLEGLGVNEPAAALRDAIDFSSTGSEILFGLRFHLHQLVARADVPDDLDRDAKALADAIDAALKR